MTNDELKKKIMDIVLNVVWEGCLGNTYHFSGGRSAANAIADALIAAGIGDLKEHRIFAGKDGSIKQLYSGEEVEKIVKERKELKDELRSKVEYIHEQAEVIKEYKHRAARSERALHCLARSFAEAMCKDGDGNHYLVDGFIQDAYSQAEKELAEERKDD